MWRRSRSSSSSADRAPPSRTDAPAGRGPTNAARASKFQGLLDETCTRSRRYSTCKWQLEQALGDALTEDEKSTLTTRLMVDEFHGLTGADLRTSQWFIKVST